MTMGFSLMERVLPSTATEGRVASWEDLFNQITITYQIKAPPDPDKAERGLAELRSMIEYALETYDAEFPSPSGNLGSECAFIAQKVVDEVRKWKRL